MAMRGNWAALLSLAMTGGVAKAEPPRPLVELRWSAPRDCPDELAMLRTVEDLLGQPLAEAGEEQVALDLRVQGDEAHGYAAKLSFVTGQGTSERDLEHRDCQKLSEGVALLAALAIDPERVRTRQQSKDAGPPPAPAAPPSPPPVVDAPTTTPPPLQARPTPDQPPLAPQPPDQQGSRRVPRPSIALMGLAGSGLLPSVGAGVGLELGARLHLFEVALVARSWAPRSAAVPGAPRASVEVSLLTAGLRLCAVPSYESWSLLACARGDLGRMSATGEQVDNARSATDGFAGLGGSLGVAYTAGRFSPRAGVDLLWTASRARFGIARDGVGVTVFEPRGWHLTGFIGLAYLL